MSTNSERAERARKVVKAAKKAARGEFYIQDLVANLLHLADAEGDSGERVLRLAEMHYTEECLEERGVS
jgi:hypothetical protein